MDTEMDGQAADNEGPVWHLCQVCGEEMGECWHASASEVFECDRYPRVCDSCKEQG